MIVVLDNIRSALNVGSIIRTCDALGVKDVWFCGITPDHGNEKVKKTSLGAEKNIRTRGFESTIDAVGELKEKGIQLLALEIGETAQDIASFTPAKEFALVVGNEVSGIPAEVLNMADTILQIPMLGTKESLNVSVAFGIAGFTLLKNLR